MARRPRGLQASDIRDLVYSLGPLEPLAPASAENALQLAGAVGDPAADNPMMIASDRGAADRRAAVDSLDAGMTAPLGSGNMLEGLARAGEAFLRTRSARDERRDELSERDRERFEREGRRAAFGRAARLTGDDADALTAQRAALLAEFAPEEAFELTQGRTSQRAARDDRRADYLFEQDDEDRRYPTRAGMENDAAIARARAIAPIEVQTAIETARGTAPYRRSGDGSPRALRGPDATLITRVRDAGAQATSLRGMAQMFAQHNRQQQGGDTGLGQDVINYFSPEQASMRQLSAQMRGLVRPANTGATSDFEQRLYAEGVPGVQLTRAQNAARIRNIEILAGLQESRQFFYEQFADEVGTLNGAEQAFQQSPYFQNFVRQHAGGGGAPAARTQGQGGPNPARVRIGPDGRPVTR